MRKILTFMTLGVAGAGYLYVQLPAPVGEPYYPNRPARSSWNLALGNFGFQTSPRSSARNLIDQVHERTRSLYNDVARQDALRSSESTDDAFERLRLVMQSTAKSMASEEHHNDESITSITETTASVVPEPGAEDLTRSVSSPAIEEQPRLTLASRPESVAQQPMAAERPIGSADDSSVPAVAVESTREVLVRENPAEEHVGNLSQSVSEPAQRSASVSIRGQAGEVRRRTIATFASNRVKKQLVSEWKIVGMSAEGRPMHSMHLGDSGMRTLVIAGIYGDDRTAVHWLELLSEELRRQPELLENNEVMLLRAGNPDGLVRNSPNNSRGVPLNRNFPSRRYRPTADLPAFAVPASEVETRVILDTLYSFRPRRVIHLGTTANKAQVLYNRSAKNAALEFERGTKQTAQMFDSEQFPGSIEDFSDGTLDAAVISMRLAIEKDWKVAWDKFRPHILATVVASPSDSGVPAVPQQADANRTPIPTARAETSTRSSRRRGYEELPPPPLR